MDGLSRLAALVAGHRLTLRQGLDFVRAKTLADAAERGGRDTGLLGDLPGRHVQAEQRRQGRAAVIEVGSPNLSVLQRGQIAAWAERPSCDTLPSPPDKAVFPNHG